MSIVSTKVLNVKNHEISIKSLEFVKGLINDSIEIEFFFLSGERRVVSLEFVDFSECSLTCYIHIL